MKPAQCPISPCGRRIAERQILCRGHWDQLPPEWQAPIQALKKSRGSAAWDVAVRNAVAYLAEREAVRRELSA